MLKQHHIPSGNTPSGFPVRGVLSFSLTSYPGLDRVLEEAKRLVFKYRGNQDIRSLALRIAQTVPAHERTGHPDMRNFSAIASNLYRWIVEHVVYVRDPHGIERLQSPDVTIRLKSGDCDDMSILGASLLESVGIPSRFVIVSFAPGQPEKYSHIYVEFYHKGQWISFDPTLAKGIGILPSSPITGRKTIALNDSVPQGTTNARGVRTSSLSGGSPFSPFKKKVPA